MSNSNKSDIQKRSKELNNKYQTNNNSIVQKELEQYIRKPRNDVTEDVNVDATSTKCRVKLSISTGKNRSNKGKVTGESVISRDILQYVYENQEQFLDRLKLYNTLLKFQKTLKEDQLVLYRKLRIIDELYLRNTAAILRLGFCPCLVHRQTSPVGDRLMTVHHELSFWDKKIEKFCCLVQESTTCKYASSILQIIKSDDGADTLSVYVDPGALAEITLPEIESDLQNPYIEQLGISKLSGEWKEIRKELRDGIYNASFMFQDICTEFGVTRGPAASPSKTREYLAYDYSFKDEYNNIISQRGERELEQSSERVKRSPSKSGSTSEVSSTCL